MMGVVVLAVIGAIVLITINGIGFKIAGYALAGATLLGMLIFYIVTKNKMPSTSKVYISEVSKMINKFVFADNRFTDTTLYEDRKLSSVELGLDKVYKEAVDCGSRNFIKAKYNGKEFEVSEVALYIMEGSGRKSVKKVAFLGKYISMVNDLKFDGRFVFNIKRKEKPFDQPTDIDDLKLITELELARDQAEKSNNAKSDFLSSMSHELRTPLNAIVGCTDLIMNTDDVSEIHDDCKDIINASNNLIELVDGILDFNKIENNSLELVERDYNPLDLFNNLVNLYNSKIGDKNITIESMISDKLPKTLYGDSDKIKAIINNLLSNALKYTNEGLIQLSVTCFNVKDRCNLTITVSDSGMGISQEDSEHIFEKFYRSVDNKNSDIEGTGLGLAITKSFVDTLNGKIVVNSEVNQGTTFIVSISQLIKETNDKDDIL